MRSGPLPSRRLNAWPRAANEPDLVEMVDAFATAAVETPVSVMTVHALAQMKESLETGAGNYVWFQMMLVARATWDAAPACHAPGAGPGL